MYMGFGLQKWIYTQKPRKFFRKRRIPVCDTIDPTSNPKDNLIIEGRRSARVEDIDKDLEEIKERIAQRRRIGIFNGSLLIIGLLAFISLISYKAFIYNSQTSPVNINHKEINEEDKAFHMMIDYGDAYLKKKDYEKALIEYKQAVKLFPGKLEGEIALANGYYFLCIDQNQDCNEALNLYTKLLMKYPNSKLFLKKKAGIYMHLQEFDKADAELNKITSN